MIRATAGFSEITCNRGEPGREEGLSGWTKVWTEKVWFSLANGGLGAVVVFFGGVSKKLGEEKCTPGGEKEKTEGKTKNHN